MIVTQVNFFYKNIHSGVAPIHISNSHESCRNRLLSKTLRIVYLSQMLFCHQKCFYPSALLKVSYLAEAIVFSQTPCNIPHDCKWNESGCGILENCLNYQCMSPRYKKLIWKSNLQETNLDTVVSFTFIVKVNVFLSFTMFLLIYNVVTRFMYIIVRYNSQLNISGCKHDLRNCFVKYVMFLA